MRMISLETAIDEISAYAKRLKEEKYHAGAKVIRECHRILTSLPSIERGNCQSCARCSDKPLSFDQAREAMYIKYMERLSDLIGQR